MSDTERHPGVFCGARHPEWTRRHWLLTCSLLQGHDEVACRFGEYDAPDGSPGESYEWISSERSGR